MYLVIYIAIDWYFSLTHQRAVKMEGVRQVTAAVLLRRAAVNHEELNLGVGGGRLRGDG